MPSVKCALCDIQITEENDSKEHVIPNAIGGRKKITGFICNACNTKSGEDWDAELSKQLNPLSLFFGINRERGVPPSQVFTTAGGEKRLLHADGTMDIAKSEFKETVSGKTVTIQMKVKSIKEAKERLKGVKKRYPHVDLDDFISKIEVKPSYSHDPIEFNLSIGGTKAGRSIVKSTLALAVASGVSPQLCEHACEYLLNDNGTPCFGYYYEKDIVINRPEGIPLHCVFVRGDPSTRQILGYVEFFGVHRMAICLSSFYEGEEFTNCYAINPLNGRLLNIEVNLNLSPDDIQETYNYKKYSSGAIEAALEQVVPLGLSASFEKEKTRVINKAVKYAFANCGAKEGEILTEEQKNKLSGLAIEKMLPFLIHNMTKNSDR